MRPACERYVWLLEQFSDESVRHDVLERDFVDAYIEYTGAKFKPSFYGAYWCDALRRDLGHLHKEKALKRHATGISGMGGMGFPKWVYAYRRSYRYQHVLDMNKLDVGVCKSKKEGRRLREV